MYVCICVSTKMFLDLGNLKALFVDEGEIF